MISEPKLENRPEQHYMGIQLQTPLNEFPAVIDKTFPELFAWLEKQGITPSGAPIIRYHVINMETKLDVEFGIPVASAAPGDSRVKPAVLPAGRYATLLYTGNYSGLMDATRVLVEWAKENGIEWDRWDDPNGDAFRSRFESYITDPVEEPDPTKWETGIVIKVADN